MVVSDDLVVRRADVSDVPSVCEFGERHIRPHYAPLIGARAADAQVVTWWNADRITSAASAGLLLLAETQGRVVAVAQHGRNGVDDVIYKLYVDPGYRGRGLGPRMIAAVLEALPPDARRICVEHFAGNVRAAAFYEREGFVVERVEPSGTGAPELDVVWRTRNLDGEP